MKSDCKRVLAPGRRDRPGRSGSLAVPAFVRICRPVALQDARAVGPSDSFLLESVLSRREHRCCDFFGDVAICYFGGVTIVDEGEFLLVCEDPAQVMKSRIGL